MGLGELWVPRVLREADVVVSMPKLKTHHWVGVTLSLKNCFGCMPGRVYGWPKDVLHVSGHPELDRRHLRRGSPFPRDHRRHRRHARRRPDHGRSRRLGVVIVSRDGVAADVTGARMMGMDPEKVGYLMEAGRFLGQARSELIEQRGRRPGAPRAAVRACTGLREPGRLSGRVARRPSLLLVMSTRSLARRMREPAIAIGGPRATRSGQRDTPPSGLHIRPGRSLRPPPQPMRRSGDRPTAAKGARSASLNLRRESVRKGTRRLRREAARSRRGETWPRPPRGRPPSATCPRSACPPPPTCPAARARRGRSAGGRSRAARRGARRSGARRWGEAERGRHGEAEAAAPPRERDHGRAEESVTARATEEGAPRSTRRAYGVYDNPSKVAPSFRSRRT